MATKPKRKRIQIIIKPKLMFSTDLSVNETKVLINEKFFLGKTD